MSTRLTLTIPEPCHENWATMTPAAQGRHCAACNKVVLDFTQRTDAEILTMLTRIATPCGRVRADQLHRPLLPAPMPTPRWQTWLAAAATVWGLRGLAAEQSQGQHLQVHHDILTRDEQKVALLHQRHTPPADTTKQVVRGRVTDQHTGEGQAGVTVLLQGTTIGTSTGPDGTFELLLPASVAPNQLVQFSFIGFVKEERQLDAMIGQHTMVALSYDTQQLGGLIVVGSITPSHSWYTPRSMWQRLSKPFRRW